MLPFCLNAPAIYHKSNVCTVHSRWWISGVTYRPADDATIIYLSESIQGSPRIAIQFALGRGCRFTTKRMRYAAWISTRKVLLELLLCGI